MKRTNTARWVESAHRWQINVQHNGVRKTFTSSTPGRTGQREANRKADAWLEQGLKTRTMTAEAAHAIYMEREKKVTGKSSWRPKDSRWRIWIAPAIGPKRLESIHISQLQGILDDARAQGKSRKHIGNIFSDITAFFRWCRENGYTTLTTDALKMPSGAPRGERKILHPRELTILLNSDRTRWRGREQRDEFVHLYRLIVLTGMRPGEALGLEWADVLPDRLELRRSRNIYEEITQGKNDNARRAVALSTLARAELDAQREETGRFPRVFPPCSEKCAYDHWRRYCKANGITPISLYELRHTFVSIAQELPEAYVKRLVGHSRNMDTFGTYGHAVAGDAEKIAAGLDAIFASKK